MVPIQSFSRSSVSPSRHRLDETVETLDLRKLLDSRNLLFYDSTITFPFLSSSHFIRFFLAEESPHRLRPRERSLRPRKSTKLTREERSYQDNEGW